MTSINGAVGGEPKQCVARFSKKASFSKTSGSSSRNRKSNFVSYFWPLALEIEEACKIPAKVSLAQAALETGWGTSGGFKRGKNAFGLGTSKRYNHIHDSAIAYCYYLTQSKGTRRAYKGLRSLLDGNQSQTPDPVKVIDQLKNYAEDRLYREKLRYIVKNITPPSKLALCSSPGDTPSIAIALKSKGDKTRPQVASAATNVATIQSANSCNAPGGNQ